MQYEIGISRYGDNKKNVCGSACIIFNENMKVESSTLYHSINQQKFYTTIKHSLIKIT